MKQSLRGLIAILFLSLLLPLLSISVAQATPSVATSIQQAFVAVANAERQGASQSAISQAASLLNQSINGTNLSSFEVSQLSQQAASLATAAGQQGSQFRLLTLAASWIMVPVVSFLTALAYVRSDDWHDLRERRKFLNMAVTVKETKEEE